MALACPNCFFALEATPGQPDTMRCGHCGHVGRPDAPRTLVSTGDMAAMRFWQVLYSIGPTAAILVFFLAAVAGRMGTQHEGDSLGIAVVSAFAMPVFVGGVMRSRDRRDRRNCRRFLVGLICLFANIVMIVGTFALMVVMA